MLERLFARYPLLGGLFGLLVASIAAGLLPAMWRDYQRYPDQPRRLDIAAAVELAGDDEWVTITGATVRCDDAVTEDDRVYTPLVGPGRIVIAYDKDLCRGGPPREVTGTIAPMSASLEQDINERGLTTRVGSRPPLALATYGGKDNERMGLIVLPILIALGLAMYPALLLQQRRASRRA